MLAPDQLGKDHDEDCRQVTAPMAKDGDTIASCETQAGTIAGHRAKIITFTASEHVAGSPVPRQVAARVIDIPLDDRTVEMRIWTGGTVEARDHAHGRGGR